MIITTQNKMNNYLIKLINLAIEVIANGFDIVECYVTIS